MATSKAAAKMDLERLSFGNALGLKLGTELEAMNVLYASDYASGYEFNCASVTQGKTNNAPSSSKARYITDL